MDFLRGHKLRSRLRRMLGLGSVADLTSSERRSLWPGARSLPRHLVARCRVLPSREEILDYLPKGGVGMEVGCAGGDFSAELLTRTEPRCLHLLDIEAHWIDFVGRRFASEVAAGQIKLHTASSDAGMASLPDVSLDWVYIDANHTYDYVRRDLELARAKTKPDGWIVLNDYAFFGFYDFTKYGVVEAVHEFCLRYDYEFLFLALQGAGYQDVALRRRGLPD